MKYNRYTVSGQFRGKNCWGISLTDALTREGKLKEVDTYSGGQIVEHGQEIFIERVIAERKRASNEKDFLAIIELDCGQIVEVWATITDTCDSVDISETTSTQETIDPRD